MNWPFIFATIALLAMGLIVLGKIFAAFGLALLVAEGIGVGIYMLHNNPRDNIGGPPNDQGPNI